MDRLWQKNSGVPAPLPFRDFDVEGRSWTDLPNNEEGRTACGYTEALARPEDTDTQTVVWDTETSSWVMVDRPTPPEPVVPDPVPLILGKLSFIRHVQEKGGMTDAMLVEAQADQRFAAFWIKFQMATAVERDDPITKGSLGALKQGGYLPAAVDDVLSSWPMTS